MTFIAVLSLLLFVCSCCCQGSRILLSPWVPFVNSRLHSMLTLGEYMVEDGHEVSVLVPGFLKDNVERKGIEIITFKMEQMDFDFAEVDMAETPDLADTGTLTGQFSMAQGLVYFELPICEHFYKDIEVQMTLKQKKFDLLFADTFYMFTRVVIDFMDIPTVLYSPDGSMFDTDIFFPSVSSFVCGKFKSYCGGDRLPFWTRLKNLVSDASMHFYFLPSLCSQVDHLREKFNINASVPSRDAYRKHVVIANMDYLMEAPRPTMPHIIPVPGLFINEPKPIENAEIRSFMDSASAGAIVMSLGTVMGTFGKERNEAIAGVFKELDQKVVWKYTGETQILGSNTLARPWLPQPELLAHENTVLFITHGGSHSMFEAGYRSLPVICIPFYLDQFAQCNNLVNRLQMGVLLNPKDITRQSFQKAIQEVLNKPEYKANAKKVQSVMIDQPMKSRDLFLYWIKYTIRHQGAQHLVSTAPFEMNMLQYLSIDVVAFLTLLPLMVLVILVKVFCLICCSAKVSSDKNGKKDN